MQEQLPRIENEQEENRTLVEQIVKDSIKNSFDQASDTDLIKVTITGVLDTAPTTPFKIECEATKADFETTLKGKIEEILSPFPNVKIKTLDRSFHNQQSDLGSGYKSLLS